MRVLSLFALAAPLVSAIQFTEPTTNSTLQKGETYSVKWDFVDTDPTTFSIFLVNFVDWPPFYTQVASDVQTTDGEYYVTVPCDVDSSWGFQFNAINGTNVYVIHAQTDEFYISNGACSGSKPTSAAPICSTATVTVTETAAVSTVTVVPTCPALSGTTTVAVPSASGSFPAGSKPTDGPEDEPTETEKPAPPAVTAPPSLDDAEDDEDEDITSTVYTTVYRDLSEVEECGPCEA